MIHQQPLLDEGAYAVKAHLTVVMTALSIARYLQDATGLSIKKILQALRPIQQITVNIAGHEHRMARRGPRDVEPQRVT